MRVVLITGISGSGKSIALNVLEDDGFYCVDNLPVRFLQEVIGSLRDAGHDRIAVSIDDYGSGLSSLAYLKQIRADELKIDKAFVLAIDSNPKDALLVRSTIDLAHSLGMKVTAEGVETAAAMQMLALMGCDIAQGYLIARPAALNELLTFLVEDRGNERRYG